MDFATKTVFGLPDYSLQNATGSIVTKWKIKGFGEMRGKLPLGLLTDTVSLASFTDVMFVMC